MNHEAPHSKHKVHKHRKGLTLERFAAAKTSGYNKQEKKDKQFALNAKKVNQYRKLKRKLQQSGAIPEAIGTDQGPDLKRIRARAGSPAQQSDSEASDPEAQARRLQTTAAAPQPEREAHLQPAAEQNHEHHGAVQNQGRKRQKNEKPETHLQRLARHVQSDKAAAEEARLAARQKAEQHRAKVAKVQQQRKQQTSLLRKRTKTGQPVMRHRIEKLLYSIQQ